MYEKIVDILKNFTDVDEMDIRPEMRLVEDLGLNSVSYFAIVFDLEETFGITVDDDASMHLSTVQDLMDYIQGQTGSKE